jgi:hypothetical protein
LTTQDAKTREAAFEPEVEEEEEGAPLQNGAAAAPAPQPVGSSGGGAEMLAADGSGSAEQQPPGDVAGPAAEPVQAPEQAEQSTLHRLAAEVPGEGRFGLEVRKKPGDLLSREELRAQRRAAAAGKLPGAAAEKAPGGILDDLALLQRAGRPGDGMDGDGVAEEERPKPAEEQQQQQQQQPAGWRPPEGQRGDGRTRLNDLLGY